MAQPPLSQQIQQLEKELGISLFRRTSRRVELTVAGQVFWDETKEILARVDQAVEKAQRANRGEAGWLGVGFVASATYDVLPDVLRRFREQFPQVELSLYEMTSAEQIEALRTGKIHIGFARPAIADDSLIVETILEEPLVIALSETHSLSALSEVPFLQLAAEAFILYPRDPKPSYGDMIVQLCEKAGFTPQIVQETLQMQTAISLVSAGVGITLVPAALRNLQRRGVTYRSIQAPTPLIELAIAYRKIDFSPVLARFLEIIKTSLIAV